MSLGWKLRRLKAMTPGEILHRTKIAVRKKLFPPAYEKWTPREAYDKLLNDLGANPRDKARFHEHVFGSATTPEEQVELDNITPFQIGHPHLVTETVFWQDARPDQTWAGTRDERTIAPTVAEAERLLEGKWQFFGREVALSNPPNWRANLWTGQEWPDLPAKDIDYRRIDIAGGAKYAWEPGRLTFLPSLALAYRVTGRQEFKDICMRWMQDFADKNHLGRGIQQTSGIEMAIRVMSCGFALVLLELDDEEDSDKYEVSDSTKAVIGLMAQQALHCRDNLSLGSSANNHLLAELAGMTFIGAMFPFMEGGEKLLHEGHRRLEAEVLRQINPDGTSVEQSFGYVPFIWELLLYPFIAAGRADDMFDGRQISPNVKNRLSASLEFARVLRLPNGALPQIGDEDDGRILFPAVEPRLDIVGNAFATFLDAPALSDQRSLAKILSGSCMEPLEAPDGRYEFPDGGYTVWRENGILMTFDHGPLGWGSIAAHGHADALSITLFNGSDPIFVDPGVYAYHEDPEARDRFRSTPYHSTVNFGGRSQSEMLGPFLWGRRAKVTPVSIGDGFDGWCQAEVAWYTSETHRREVSVNGSIIEISDRISGVGAEIAFVLHPDTKVRVEGAKAVIDIGETHVEISSEGLEDWRIEDGEYSVRIGNKAPTTRLCANFIGNASTVRVRVS